MATWDATTEKINDAGTTSISWTHTCGGSNRLLMLAITWQDGLSERTATITYGGVSMTQVDKTVQSQINTQVWYLKNPASGANTLAVSWNANAAHVVAWSVSYTAVDQTTPLGTSATDQGAAGTLVEPSVSVSTTTSDLVFGACGAKENNGSGAQKHITTDTGGGETERGNDSSDAYGGGGLVLAAADKTGVASSTTISWTRGNTGNLWNVVAVPIHSSATTAWKDQATRFKLQVQQYADQATRLKLNVRGYVDQATRLLLRATGYADLATRFKLQANAYRDVATRLTLNVARDVQTRVHLRAPTHRDVATRLRVPADPDVRTRLKLIVIPFADVATRVNIPPWAYRDVATRLNLNVPRDVATRLVLRVFGFASVATRLMLAATGHADVSTRLALALLAYRDVATRLVLVHHLAYRDVATRLNLQRDTGSWGPAAGGGLMVEGVLATDLAAWPMADTLALVDNSRFVGLPLPLELVIGQEVVLATAGSGSVADPWTITRGQRGTTAVPHYAGASVETLPHTLEFTKGGTTWDLTTIASPQVTTRTVSPGGEADCTIELDTYDPAAYLIDADATFVLKAQGRPYFSGLVARPQIRRRDDGGTHITIVVRGYRVTLGWDVYTQTIQPGTAAEDTADDGYGWWRAFTAEHTIMQDAVRDLCPLISLDFSRVVHGGQSISKEYNGRGKTAEQIFGDVTAQGDAGEPVDWHIRTDTDGGAKLEVLRRSAAPILKIPVSTVKDIGLAWEAEQQKTKIVLTYANGMIVKQGGSSAYTRALQVDVSNTIDDLGTADYIATQLLAHASLLQAIGDSLEVEWPKKVYDHNNQPFPVWDIRAGMAVQLCNDDLTPLVAWNPNLPLGLLLIKATECNHRTHRNMLSLTEYMTFMQIASMYAHTEKKRADSVIHEPVSGPAVAPPENMTLPGSLSPSVVTPGSGGRVGYDKVAQDADISGPQWTIEPRSGDVLAPGRVADIVFPVNGQVLGFTMSGRTKDEPTKKGSVSFNVGSAPKIQVPNVGTALTTLTIADANVMEQVNLDPNQNVPNHVLNVNAGDHLTGVINTVTGFAVLEILPIFRRTEGSIRATSTAAPTITQVSAARDANNLTTFTITADRAVYAQIEYGPDTTYGSRSAKSELVLDHPQIGVGGLPSEPVHYRVHLWNADGVETVGTDHTL